MPDPLITPNRCPRCGALYPEAILVCPECREILDTPPVEKKTPAWVIALLLIIIAALATYAGYLVYAILVQRRF
ncbi:MAG TPA: hypothetical protein PLZ36_02075 [Armatimonadota bacterium]|nr:hypothetical protein [Armatimonadota bacterium]